MRGQPGLLSDDACRHTACAEDQSSEYVVLLSTVWAGLWRHNSNDEAGLSRTLRPTFTGQTARHHDERRDDYGRRRRSADRIPVRHHGQLSGGVQSNGRLFDYLVYFDGDVGTETSRLEDVDLPRKVMRFRMDSITEEDSDGVDHPRVDCQRKVILARL